ncbi:uncharacterized protein [Nicotiana sylvestris]|uniref:uncharacterized protein n=1 Tax=Nicotiana sylvestris TaxID=4096 RepID=UPI00388CA0EC
MTQASLSPTDPTISQAGGGAQAPTAQALGHTAVVYQTPSTLPEGGAQPAVTVAPEPRPAEDGNPQKLLDRWTRLHPPIFGGERHEDAQDFIDRCRDRLYNMRILDSNGSLGTPIYVSTSMGYYVVVDQVYRSCVVIFYGYETRADLLLLDMINFEVILSMYWLSPYHAILDCHAKIVTLAMPEMPRLEWKGSFVSTSSRVIYFLNSMIDSVPIVWVFANMFPSDLPGMPPDCDIDFCIDLAPGT